LLSYKTTHEKQDTRTYGHYLGYFNTAIEQQIFVNKHEPNNVSDIF